MRADERVHADASEIRLNSELQNFNKANAVSMQPATPTSTLRPTYAARIPSSRPPSPRRAAINARIPPNSFLRLFVGALAIAASRSWVLGHSEEGSGGAGWLVLTYWAFRVFDEARLIWSGPRRRGSTSLGQERWQNMLAKSGTLAIQSLSFFVALERLGPFQIAIIGYTASVLGSAKPSNIRSAATMAPITIASIYVLVQVYLAHDHVPILITFVYALSTLVIEAGLLRSVRPVQYQDKDAQKTHVALRRTIASAGIAVAVIFGLFLTGTLPLPIPLSSTTSQLVGSFFAAFLVPYIPFSFSASSPSPSSIHLKSSRDKSIFLAILPLLQFFALHPMPTAIDVLALLPLAVISVWSVGTPKAQSEGTWSFPNQALSTARTKYSFLSILPPKWRPHFQTIMSSPTSSKIFYFLLLNLAYMGVQMVYGVFTNSLGLISDAIHMLFDCLGIAVGLWASVAATWKPDGRYTFGYTRVETLSGFANGCFLILISVFIMFEAIQRVYDPPEMETQQLLLVSGIGLAINLFGMWATGGHHHHGHGHDHGHAHSHSTHDHSHHLQDHSHDHSHASSQVAAPPRLQKRKSSGVLSSGAVTPISSGRATPANHEEGHVHGGGHHEHEESNGHQHHAHKHDDHTHTHTPPPKAHSHSHDCDRDRSHSYAHAHDDHDHSHNHDDHHDHAHSHNMRGVFLHVLADTLGSVGVIVSTILIRFTGWTGFDPIASLFIAALIMASVIPLVIDTGRVLCLDSGEVTEGEVRKALAELSNIDGLANYAAPRFWPRCEGEIVGSIHIQLAPAPSSFDPGRHGTPPNHSHSHSHAHGKNGEVIYSNVARVVARVEKVLKKRIRGLSELVVQVEGGSEKSFCTCMTGGGK
ncbi:hypothetical protein L198_07146 [Cryptococcus wingfieldii CBS 7118]|uniref:Cation efflux protein transmembrane domain-containing protein n=1 Tax=Cryptococcus wingfieldii CBS 7118 TaxID=1295528 RepID=A0A1E3IEX6_9TREE|nr:hypothetical protein L198_07146 [Cryptococcus wingfieldii CBS 7118]ODN87143.1 hypothetical protein L198_07146 [Cryptococcus wingfieldii CBS 7118]